MDPGPTCPFCKLAQGLDDSAVESKQSDVFYRGTRIIAFISAGWWPNNPGSVMVIPIEHYSTIYDIPPSLYAEVNEFARRLAALMKEEYRCDGISLRQHNEAAGGQSIDHYHLWVFPRYQGDRLYELYSQGSIVPVEIRSGFALRLKRRFV